MRNYTMDEIKAICGAARLPMDVPFIDKRLEEYEFKYNGAYPYYAAFRDLVRALEPGVVLEVGTWQGTSAAAFAAGNHKTAVITIDHHSDPGDEENQRRTLEVMNEFHNVIYAQGCSSEKVTAEKPGTTCTFPYIRDLLAVEGKKIDIFLIDGWHEATMAQADFDTYKDLLAENALVICDDIYGGDCATISGMLGFWENMPGEKWLCSSIHGGYPMGLTRMGK